MAGRESLHRLIDTLPEGALETTERVLQNYQTWPPRPPIELETMRKRVEERFQRTARKLAAKSGSDVVGASFSRGHFQPDGNFSASVTGWEDDSFVTVEMRSIFGYKLELEEKIRLFEDKNLLLYSIQVTGPSGAREVHHSQFELSDSR